MASCGPVAIRATTPCPAEEYTDERLIAAVHANRGRPPEELLEALLADVHRFCGRATPSDDVTMVVVRYEG